jgi:hypothetical protein
VIEPNRLTAPGEHPARARVEVVLERIDALGADLFVLPVPRLDVAARDADLDDLEAVADRHGRDALLAEARERVRGGLLVRTARRAEAIGYRQQLVSSGTVEDQVARAMAIEDAVAVAVVEDMLDPGTAARLASPGRWMLGLPTSEPVEPVEAAPNDDPPLEPDERDDADRAEAELAEAEAEQAEAQSALRLRRGVLFVVIGAIALPAAAATGVSVPVLVVIVLGLAVIAWLFADP